MKMRGNEKKLQGDIGASSQIEPRSSGATALNEARDAERFVPLADHDSAPEQGAWVEGQMIASAMQTDETDMARREAAPAPAQLKSEHQKSKKVKYATQANTLSNLDTRVHVSQKPVSLLPPVRQQQQASNSLQSFIEQRNDSTFVTLFTNSPLPSYQLQEATIESVTSDSIVLNLQGQRIGFKLPFALQNKVGRKSNEVK